MIKKPSWNYWLGLLLSFSLILSACRSRQAPPPPPTATPTTIPSPQPTNTPTQAPAPTALKPIEYLVDVEDAIIQVEAQGRFFSPKFSKLTTDPGRGSGFIIDPSGLAITSNHAVAGAEAVKVWVGNDRSHPYTAEVVASSECYDLALIDLEGDGFPFLSLSDAPIAKDQKVYAAGFPLGGSHLSLNGGSVVGLPDDGKASDGSVLPFIKYDAETNPGMSGGPILTPEGKVIGVHYKGDAEQGLAYGVEMAALQDVIKSLEAGVNSEWIGVNGQPVASDDGTMIGMWVFAVQPGSPAETSGVVAGDLITVIGKHLLAPENILEKYCQGLREWDTKTPLDLQVYRQTGDSLLEGQLNGNKLVVVTTAALGIQPTPAEGTPNAPNVNATKPGEVYLNENFIGALINWSRLILQGDETKVKSEIKDQNLFITIDSVYTYVYYLLKPVKVTDVRLDISVENLGRNNNNISLICRYSLERGWYEFNIASNGLWWVKRFDPRLNNFIDVGKGASTLIKLGQAANDYGAVCKDNKLTLYINGKQIKTFTDNNLATGQVGFSISSFNVTPVTVKIDSFKASVP